MTPAGERSDLTRERQKNRRGSRRDHLTPDNEHDRARQAGDHQVEGLAVRSPDDNFVLQSRVSSPIAAEGMQRGCDFRDWFRDADVARPGAILLTSQPSMGIEAQP